MSAQRFGGQYSPNAASKPGATAKASGNVAQPGAKFRGKRASSVDVRTILMFILPTPILLSALGSIGRGEALRTGIVIAIYALLIFAAYLLREGQKAADAFDARPIARPPAFPRKIAAAGLTGLGVAGASWISQTAGTVLEMSAGLFTAIGFGALTVVAHVIAFGIDPMKAKGVSGIGQAELDRVTDAIDQAESKLSAIEATAKRLKDKDITARVAGFGNEVREMLGIVQNDPSDLGRARRYLGIYLNGADEALTKYADSHTRLDDPKIRTDLLDLLGDLEASFARGREALLLDDKTDLEVEIEVLRDRLAQEAG